MNLRDLKYIIAIDRYRSFSRAAEACHVSQPALSAQVRRFEGRLGVELFARTNSGVHTTEAGNQVIARAKEVLHQAQLMFDTATHYQDPLEAPFRLGIISSFAPYALPFIVDAGRQVSERLKFIFRELPNNALFAELEERKIDFAMIGGAVDIEGYSYFPLFIEPLTLMVKKKHRLAEVESVSAASIPVEEMILLSGEFGISSKKSSLHQKRNFGLDFPTDMHATSFLTISHYLQDDLGCSLVPKLACDAIGQANPDVSFINIEEDTYSREIGFIGRSSCPRIDALHSLSAQMRANPPAHLDLLAYADGHHQR